MAPRSLCHGPTGKVRVRKRLPHPHVCETSSSFDVKPEFRLDPWWFDKWLWGSYSWVLLSARSGRRRTTVIYWGRGVRGVRRPTHSPQGLTVHSASSSSSSSCGSRWVFPGTLAPLWRLAGGAQSHKGCTESERLTPGTAALWGTKCWRRCKAAWPLYDWVKVQRVFLSEVMFFRFLTLPLTPLMISLRYFRLSLPLAQVTKDSAQAQFNKHDDYDTVTPAELWDWRASRPTTYNSSCILCFYFHYLHYHYCCNISGAFEFCINASLKSIFIEQSQIRGLQFFG